MCKLDELRAKREEIYRIARAYKVDKLYVFGSCARGEDTQKSDIDLLAEFHAGASLLDHSNVMREISNILHAKVDVVSSRGLHPYIAKQIWKDAIPL